MFWIWVAAALLVVALAAALTAYYFLGKEEKKPAPTAGIKTPKEPVAGEKAAPKKPFPLPPEIPRTIGTIKIITREAPEVTLNVIRLWLRKPRP